MIKRILPLLLFSFVLFSCNSTLEQPNVTSIDQTGLDECDTAACPQVSIDYITYNGKPEKVKAVNDSINQFIIAVLNLGDPAAQAAATNPKEAIAGFIKDYWRDTSEFPEINEYEAEVSVVENFRSEELISISMSQYNYTGGAHGNSTVDYMNVNAKTGEIITNDRLLKDKNSLAKLAEKELRLAYKIPEKEPINSGIFWFEEDTFYLSNDMGVENDSFIIHYNQYEIASYADGPIDIVLPLVDVAPFLNYSLNK